MNYNFIPSLRKLVVKIDRKQKKKLSFYAQVTSADIEHK